MSNTLAHDFLALLVLILLCIPAAAASASGPPAMLWEKTFNISGSDTAHDICQTPDGGFVIVGSTFTSSSRYVTDTQAIFLVRTDAGGNELWRKTYQGPGYAQGSAVAVTEDGGFVIVGNGNSALSQHPSILLIRTDAEGNPSWERTYGKGGSYVGESVIQMSDGGYAVCGWMAGEPDMDFQMYVLRTGPSGDMIWEREIGGAGLDHGNALIESPEGGLVVTGWTNSVGAGSGDLYLVMTDASGNVQWEKTYGGSFYDFAEDVKGVPGGGYIIAGMVSGPIDTTNPAMSMQMESIYLVRTDASGNAIWERTLGYRDWDSLAHSVDLTPDGGFIVAGQKMSGNQNWDMHLVRTDENGLPVWEHSWGGEGFDAAYAVILTDEGSYVAAGARAESPGEGNDLHAYLAHLAPDGGTPESPMTGALAPTTVPTFPAMPRYTPPPLAWEQTYRIGIQDQAMDIIATRDGGYAIAGITTTSDTSLYPGPPFPQDAFLLRTDEDGKMVWNHTYGGISGDGANAVRETSDGGFILAGYTSGPEHHDGDRYLVRTDGAGSVLWERHYQSPGFDALYGVYELPGGGFVVAGESTGDQNFNRRDMYLAWVDENGGILREKTYPGEYSNGARALEPTPDGGYILSGYGNPALIKVTSTGEAEWMSDHQGGLASARPAADGGYIATGTEASRETGYSAMTLHKMDHAGKTAWVIRSPDRISSGSATGTTGEGGFLAVGTATILTGGLTARGIPFSSSISVLHTDSNGNLLWNMTLSPSRYNEGTRILRSSDGGFIVLGNTADQANGAALYAQGYMPGKIYLAKLAPGKESGGMTIPLLYAPVCAFLVLFVLLQRRGAWK
ncbi:MAG: hypothetical protein WC382_08385 [Methanoregulaceae archaeon]|jgi:hypothetical protein